MNEEPLALIQTLIPQELKDKILKLAKEDDRTLSSWLRQLLSKTVK